VVQERQGRLGGIVDRPVEVETTARAIEAGKPRGPKSYDGHAQRIQRSRVAPMSRIDLTPEATTSTGVRERVVKSADSSKLCAAPR